MGIDQRQPYEMTRRLKGIGFMFGAVVCLSVLDTTAKYLTTESGFPVMEVIWLRFAWHVFFNVLFFCPGGFSLLRRSVKPSHQILRAFLMLGATAFNFTALQYLQLDQVITIFFLTPLIVAGLSGPLLGEWVGWRRLSAIAAGFAGVILVTRPGFGGIHWAVAFSLAAAFSYAFFNLLTRYVSRHDSVEVTQFFTPLAGVVIIAPLAFTQWVWPSEYAVWGLLASLGLSGGLGHWLLIKAHQYAPAPVVAPYIYTGIISMSVLGYAVFGHVPNLWTVGGGAIVIGSGLYLFWRERAPA